MLLIFIFDGISKDDNLNNRGQTERPRFLLNCFIFIITTVKISWSRIFRKSLYQIFTTLIDLQRSLVHTIRHSKGSRPWTSRNNGYRSTSWTLYYQRVKNNLRKLIYTFSHERNNKDIFFKSLTIYDSHKTGWRWVPKWRIRDGHSVPTWFTPVDVSVSPL